MKQAWGRGGGGGEHIDIYIYIARLAHLFVLSILSLFRALSLRTCRSFSRPLNQHATLRSMRPLAESTGTSLTRHTITLTSISFRAGGVKSLFGKRSACLSSRISTHIPRVPALMNVSPPPASVIPEDRISSGRCSSALGRKRTGPRCAVVCEISNCFPSARHFVLNQRYSRSTVDSPILT